MTAFRFGFVGLLLLLAPSAALANAVPVEYTNDNYSLTQHEEPASFSIDSLGNFQGTTVSGRLFTQENISNSFGIRLQKFSIDKAFFYISDKGQIWADNDISALSVYLSLMT